MKKLLTKNTLFNEENEPADYLTKTLKKVLVVFLIVDLILLINNLLWGGVFYDGNGNKLFISIGINLITGVFLYGLIYYLRLGYYKFVSWMSVVILTIAITISVVSFDGLHDVFTVSYFVVVVFAGLFLGKRAVVGTSVTNVLILIGVFALEVWGGVEYSVSGSSGYRLLTLSSTIITLGVITYMIIDQLHQSIASAQIANVEKESISGQYDHLFTTSAMGIVICDVEGVITDVSAEGNRLFGYREGELIGMSVEALIPDRYIVSHIKKRGDFIANPHSREMGTGLNLMGVRKDDSQFMADISIHLNRLSGDMEITCFVQDISEKKFLEMETRLLLSIATVINNVENAYDAFGTIVAQFCNYTGWDMGEVWMPNSEETHLEYIADLAHSRNKNSKKFKEFIKSSKGFIFKKNIGLPGRVWASRDIEWNQDVTTRKREEFKRFEQAKQFGIKAAVGVPILTGDKVIAVLVFFSKRTKNEDQQMANLVTAVASQAGMFFQRKLAVDALGESERRLKEAQGIAKLGHWERSLIDDSEIWSDEQFNVLELPLESEEASFENFITRVYFEDLARVKEIIENVSIKNKGYQIDFRIITAEGNLKHVRSNAVVVNNESDVPTKLVGTLQDVTEQMQSRRELEVIATLSEILRAAVTTNEMIKILLYQTMYLLEAQGSVLMMLDEDKEMLEVKGGSGIWRDDEFGQHIPKNMSMSEKVFRDGKPYLNNKIKEAPGDIFFKVDQVKMVESVVCVPLITQEKIIGVLWVGKDFMLSQGDLRIIQTICDIAANALVRIKAQEDMETLFVETVLALAKTLDARDTAISDHSQKTSLWAELTLQKMGGLPRQIENVRLGALLHDIGKIGMPDKILHKEGPLTEEEFEIMKQHPDIGSEIVAPIRMLENVAPIIRAHQEKYDGTGYPLGLKGEEIPLEARVLTIIDAYAAMTEDRPYRKRRSSKKAAEELMLCKGVDFDPEVVDTFLKVLSEFTDI